MPRTLFLVLAYNQEKFIAEAVRGALAQTGEPLDILVSDDNSPDGTGDIADSMANENDRVFVLHREGKLGLGTAYLAGFKWATECRVGVAKGSVLGSRPTDQSPVAGCPRQPCNDSSGCTGRADRQPEASCWQSVDALLQHGAAGVGLTRRAAGPKHSGLAAMASAAI